MKAKKSYKKGGKFPDLTGDGKVTKKDILKGRGVFGKKDKSVAQGADKEDIRAERKMNRKENKKYDEGGKVYDRAVGRSGARKRRVAARKAKRQENKRSVERGTFDVGVDGKTEKVEGKLVTKRKSAKGSVAKFVAKGAKNSVVKKIKDKKKMGVNAGGETIVTKSKKTTKYRKNLPPVKKKS